ncbi:hypothetical protein PISMIDRAFT_687974, partial [Pisolithus microcarpus 441]
NKEFCLFFRLLFSYHCSGSRVQLNPHLPLLSSFFLILSPTVVLYMLGLIVSPVALVHRDAPSTLALPLLLYVPVVIITPAAPTTDS